MIATQKATVLRKLKAKRLYVNGLLTAAEVSEKVDATPKTVGTWIKEGNWNELRDKAVKKILGNDSLPLLPDIVLSDLIEFTKETAPHLAKKVQQIVNAYLNQII